MKIESFKTRIFEEGEDIVRFIVEHVKKVPEDSIVAITSKIVSLSEGRTSPNSSKNREELIKKESDFSLENSWFSIKDGMIMAAGGVDESNGNGRLIMLPKDSYKSAAFIRASLKRKWKVKNLGILITDSNFLPLRNGAIGVALGY